MSTALQAQSLAPNDDATIALLQNRKEKEGDAFRVKVFRFKGGGQLSQLALTADDVHLDQIVNPEQWITRLIGGGPVFHLCVYHASDPTLQVGQSLKFRIEGEERPFTGQALSIPGYVGPKKILYPPIDDRAPAPLYAVPPTSPSPQGSFALAPQTQVPGGSSAGSGYLNIPPIAAPAEDAMRREREEIARREAEVREMRHRIEMDQLKRESEARTAALEGQLREISQSLKTPHAPPKTDWAPIVAAVAPIVTALLQGQEQARQAAVRSQEETSKQTQALLTTLIARPAIDPTMEKALDRMTALIERKNEEEPPSMKMFSSLSDAMGTVLDMTSRAIQMVADVGKPEPEPVGLMITREVAKGLQALASASQIGRMGGAPRALPQGQPGFAGMPQQAPVPPQGQQMQHDPQVVERTEQMIRVRHDPAQVAAYFVSNLASPTVPGNPHLEQALQQVGNDPFALLQQRLGTWLTEDPQNGAYVQLLAQHLEAQLRATGRLPEQIDQATGQGPEDEDDEEGEE